MRAPEEATSVATILLTFLYCLLFNGDYSDCFVLSVIITEGNATGWLPLWSWQFTADDSK